MSPEVEVRTPVLPSQWVSRTGDTTLEFEEEMFGLPAERQPIDDYGSLVHLAQRQAYHEDEDSEFSLGTTNQGAHTRLLQLQKVRTDSIGTSGFANRASDAGSDERPAPLHYQNMFKRAP